MAKVKVDADKCIGCGTCSDIASSVFEIKDGISCPKGELTDENKADVESAIESCPVGAIEIEE